MFAPRNIALCAELLKEAEEKIALDPSTLKALLGLGVGAAGGGTAAHLLTKHHEEKKRKKTRAVSFGAGVAAGAATPKLLRSLIDIAQRRGMVAPPVPEGVPQ